MARIYGYLCQLSAEDLAIDRHALTTTFGCTDIRESRNGRRRELASLMRLLRQGDTLVCPRMDHLSRSLRGLQNIVHELRAKGAHLKVTAHSVEGEDFLRWLDVFSEFEMNATRERQREGVHAAKMKGAYKGRPRTINADAIARLQDTGLGPSEIAKRLKISRASVYRLARRQLPDTIEGSGPQRPHFAVRVVRGLSGVLGRTNLHRKAK
jgi:DNA invertase Pin-like site-specific DNA recombinase